MRCPNCGIEGTADLKVCDNCGREIAETPAADPAMPFIPVMETSDRLRLAMAKGLLDEAGLAYLVTGDEISLSSGIVDALFHRNYILLVGRDAEAEARSLLDLIAAE